MKSLILFAVLGLALAKPNFLSKREDGYEPPRPPLTPEYINQRADGLRAGLNGLNSHFQQAEQFADEFEAADGGQDMLNDLKQFDNFMNGTFHLGMPLMEDFYDLIMHAYAWGFSWEKHCFQLREALDNGTTDEGAIRHAFAENVRCIRWDVDDFAAYVNIFESIDHSWPIGKLLGAVAPMEYSLRKLVRDIESLLEATEEIKSYLCQYFDNAPATTAKKSLMDTAANPVAELRGLIQKLEQAGQKREQTREQMGDLHKTMQKLQLRRKTDTFGNIRRAFKNIVNKP